MTVTQRVKLCLITFLFVLLGCNSPETDMTKSWIVKKINKNVLVDKNDIVIDEIILDKIYCNFAATPYYESYDELKISGAYYRENDQVYLLIFDNLYVDDIQIVYELNQSNMIIDRYLLSEWK